MNISAYILEYLKKYGSVAIPGFGVFFLEKTKAILDPDNGSILPPSGRVGFRADFQAESDEFVQFVASKNSSSLENIIRELTIQTDFWKKRLQADQQLQISDLGILSADDNGYQFTGKRVSADHPDFYGLEEIRFSDIGTGIDSIESRHDQKDYQFSRSVLWIFLIIIPVAGIAYLAYAQKDLLFGNKSFDSLTVQTKTRRIETGKTAVTKDSLPASKKDSLTAQLSSKDTLSKADTITKAETAKWHPKYKKRKSKKWHR